jgi:two-component system cell cycle response regulator
MVDSDLRPAGLHILLVEDSPLQLAQMRAHLTARGHEVVEARNGAEALILLQHEHPDLVISDCVMPLLDGYQFCRLLKDDRATRHIPVLLLTSQGNPLSPFWARTCGADRFLNKSPDMEGLMNEAMALFESHSLPPSRRPRHLAPEELGVDAIQRRLSIALEHRLMETSLRDAISHIYTMTGNTPDLVNHFLALIQGLVLPGAVLVVFKDDRDLLVKGIRGSAVGEEEAAELERRTLQTMGVTAKPPSQWAHIDGNPEQPGTLKEPVQISLPLSLPHVEPYGYLSVLVHRRAAQDHERLFEVAAQELSRLLSLEEARLKLYHMAVEDSLTGLPNRRLLQQILDREVDFFTRYQKTFSVLLVDVDHFKEINDTFGHPVGDEVLREVSRRLNHCLRKTDSLGRWGGDEFLVVCSHTEHAAGLILADRLRAEVRLARVLALGPRKAPLTLSIGMATWKGVEDSVDDLLRRADERLYRAKHLGRDQVATEQDPS